MEITRLPQIPSAKDVKQGARHRQDQDSAGEHTTHYEDEPAPIVQAHDQHASLGEMDMASQSLHEVCRRRYGPQSPRQSPFNIINLIRVKVISSPTHSKLNSGRLLINLVS